VWPDIEEINPVQLHVKLIGEKKLRRSDLELHNANAFQPSRFGCSRQGILKDASDGLIDL